MFCPHNVFMCFVWISEQTTIISLYNINWLVFVTETECVYCAVRTRSLYIILRSAHSVFMCFVWIWEQSAIISQYSINWLVFITETECVYCAVRTGYGLRLCSLFIFIHLHGTIFKRWNGRSWELSKKQCSFGNRISSDRVLVPSLDGVHPFLL